MLVAVVTFKNGEYELYEKPSNTQATQELLRLTHKDKRGFKCLSVSANYRAEGLTGDIIPYSVWRAKLDE